MVTASASSTRKVRSDGRQSGALPFLRTRRRTGPHNYYCYLYMTRGRPRSSQTVCSLEFRPPLVLPIHRGKLAATARLNIPTACGSWGAQPNSRACGAPPGALVCFPLRWYRNFRQPPAAGGTVRCRADAMDLLLPRLSNLLRRLTYPPELLPIFGRVCFSRGRTNETQQVQR